MLRIKNPMSHRTYLPALQTVLFMVLGSKVQDLISTDERDVVLVDEALNFFGIPVPEQNALAVLSPRDTDELGAGHKKDGYGNFERDAVLEKSILLEAGSVNFLAPSLTRLTGGRISGD